MESTTFGHTTPPLLKFLKNILDKYPEGGQIIKELVQNADDAGATEVKFLLDTRQHGIETLLTPSLADFQGASLYCYNNEVFTEDDWMGIQTVQQSVKEKDPLKVGRFGLGFVSVYHLTDMPSLMSSSQIAFFDPFTQHFGGGMTGKAFPLNDKSLKTCPDQCSPFKNILGIGDEHFFKGKFNGTLFRFPFRRGPSPSLSSTIFTQERVRELFQSFKEDADRVLLFLKHVTSVSLFEVEPGGQEQLIFEVRNDTRDKVSMSKFIGNLKETQLPTPNFNHHRMAITDADGTTQKEWLVMNTVFGDVSERMKQLAEQLQLLPWIGLAMQCQGVGMHVVDGRVFCFLPLPPCEESKTGFPVHIHGYFALSDNRRSIKWPATDQQHDLTAEWNQLLVQTLLPKAYAMLIKHSLRQSIPPSDVYAAWPTHSNIRSHWRDFLQPFIDIIFKERVFHTKANGGQWISLKEMLLDTLERQPPDVAKVSETVINYLVNVCSQPVVSLPDNILDLIKDDERDPQTISPTILRQCVREYDVTECTIDEKTSLLQFCLDDDNFQDLNDVPLLRLSDGLYTTFSQDLTRTPVLLPTNKNPRSLFPSISNSFHFVHSDLLSTAKNKLEKVAEADVAQVRFLTDDDVVKYLRETLPKEWFITDENVVEWTPGIKDQPQRNWLETLWTWLQESFTDDINQFKGLPIIPIQETNEKVQLLKLNATIPSIFATTDISDDIDCSVCSCLRRMGVIVISHPAKYLRHSQLKKYIKSMTPNGVLEVLIKCGLSKYTNLEAASCKEKVSLRRLLARLSPPEVPYEGGKFISQLPIFEVLSRSRRISDSDTPLYSTLVNPLAPSVSDELPKNIPLKTYMVTTDDPDSQKITSLLGIKPLKLIEVISKYILPDIQNGFYQSNEIDEIMVWIFQNLFRLKSVDAMLPNRLQLIPFVKTNDLTRLKPNELFDPEDSVLKILLFEQNVFPVQPYCRPEILVVLRDLGLKHNSDMTALDLLSSAVKCHDENNTGTPNIERAKALLQCLDHSPDVLLNEIDGKPLYEHLLTIKWVPRLQHRTNDYPAMLPWFQDDPSLYTPSDIYTMDQASCVGGVMPIIGSISCDNMKKYLKWDCTPSIEILIKQLHVVIDEWLALGKCKPRGFNKVVEDAVCNVYSRLQELHVKELSSSPCESKVVANMKKMQCPWVWNGDGFSNPQRMAFRSNFTFDMKPHLFEIPACVRDITSFLEECGVRNQFSDDDMVSVLSIIKGKTLERKSDSDVQRDLQLCVSILDWITRGDKQIGEYLQKKIYIPIKCESMGLHFAICTECTYCDNDSLMEELTFENEQEDCGEPLHMVHDRISNKTACLLGIPPLSRRLAKPDPLGFEFEATGPYEPLTTRLKNILSDYVEGSIFKELIQNADDAGAEEVKFLIDWRANTDHRTTLFSKEMEMCQGPALWAYNDAVFTDEDLQNINKLAGGTKKEDTNKVGRFGLGFNSVYNLTDVPSLITRNFFIMFDPHTTHIPNLIKCKSQPGIKLNLEKNPRVLRMYKDQFHVYNGIFGCDLNKQASFNSTLFRFPLRTADAAKTSEISLKVYDQEQMHELVNALEKQSLSLLLFTQHVKRVEVFQLRPESQNVRDVDLLLTLSIEEGIDCKLTPGSSSFNSFDECRQHLKRGTEYMKMSFAFENDIPPPLHLPELVSYIVKTTCNKNKQNEGKLEYDEQMWAISSCISDGEARTLALTEEGKRCGLLPCGGVAVKLQANGALKYTVAETKGELFCFLPLNIQNNMPVHINGCFAVDSHRRSIRQYVASDLEKHIEVRWNEALMKDVINKAYVHLLETLLQNDILQEKGIVYSLWPVATHKRELYIDIVRGFYNSVVRGIGTKSLPKVFLQEPYMDGDRCLSFLSVKIIDPVMKNENEDLTIAARQVVNSHLSKVPHEHQRTADIEDRILLTFEVVELCSEIQHLIVSEEQFYQQYFFPNLKTVEREVRDKFILDALTQDKWKSREYLKQLLQNSQCIPTSPHGCKLSKPSDLVNPRSLLLANLFNECDEKFPYGDYSLDDCLGKLTELGMARDSLLWTDIIERTESIQPLYIKDKSKALWRVKYLIAYLNAHWKGCPEDVRMKLCMIQFLPVLKKPKDFILPWHMPSNEILSPNNIYCRQNEFLVFTIEPVLNDDNPDKFGCGKIPSYAENFLGLIKEPSIEVVLRQLSNMIDCNNTLQCCTKLEKICSTVYEYMQRRIFSVQPSSHLIYSTKNIGSSIRPQSESELQQLRKFRKPFLFVDGTFIHPQQISFNWRSNDEPYLFRMPDYLLKFRNLLKACGVREKFGLQDFINALMKLEGKKCGLPLTDDELKMVCNWLTQFHYGKYISDDTLRYVFIPDERKILRHPNHLAYKDVDWITSDNGEEDYSFTHELINWPLAEKLGVKVFRSKKLGSYSSSEGFYIGEEFGQEEKLTDRIKGIIRDYPSGTEILKELVQNADDAKATELHFIYDRRYHNTNRVFSDSWKELQGPALCVYNDKPFTEDDIKGIQRLGIGGKRDNSEATGQYGIGFNAVYHLTDCPSFITDDTDLLVFDPCVQYVPGATRQRPGRRIKVEKLRKDFPDIVLPYLSDMLKLRGSTLFRFPLRKTKSEISENVYNEEEMKRLISHFRKEVHHILLFLNHIQTIKISEIDKDGKVKNTITVTAKLSTEDSVQRRQFSEDIIYEAKSIKKDAWKIWGMPPTNVSYFMTVKVSDRSEQQWLITRQVGFSPFAKDKHTKYQMENMVKFILPRGGTAMSLRSDSRTGFRPACESIAFCFLPLPIQTGLPFNVNGQFTLTSSRRNLLTTGNMSKWNESIQLHVIAPCVLVGLKKMKDSFYLKGNTQKPANVYSANFPMIEKVHTEWRNLAEQIYKLLSTTKEELFPVIIPSRPKKTEELCDVKNDETVKWFSFVDVYFNMSPSIKVYHTTDSLESVLLETGFPLTVRKNDPLVSLQQWPIIPAKGSLLLTPLLSRTILHSRQFGEDTSRYNFRDVETVLCKLNCQEVDYDVITCEYGNHITVKVIENTTFQLLSKVQAKELLKKHVAHITSQHDIISVLYYHFKTIKCNVSLEESDCITLLQYIQECTHAICSDKDILRKLKSLPLYFTIFGSPVSINQYEKCYVIHKGIPDKQRDVWIGQCNCALLKEQTSLKILYQQIGVEDITPENVYIKLIFPYFGKLSDEARLQHLEFLRDSPTCDRNDSLLIAQLNTLAFIPNVDGSNPLRCANQCFDQHNVIFREMLPKRIFPIAPYDTEEWHLFLKLCGLRMNVDEELYLKFAYEIENHRNENLDNKIRKAKMLVCYLLKHTHLHHSMSFLYKISMVKFVPIEKPSKEQLAICSKSFMKGETFSCFRESVSLEKDKLVWTASPLLPKWADPYHIKYTNYKHLRCSLGIKAVPSLDSVLQHCGNIGEAVSARNKSELEERLDKCNVASARFLTKVMEEIYEFMIQECLHYATEDSTCSEKCSDNMCSVCIQIHAALHDVPFVIVEDGCMMVRASQVFLQQNKCTVEPFLHCMPLKLGKYVGLFRLLGAQETATATQFAIALEEMYKLYGSNDLDENCLNIARKAIEGLFICLQNKETLVTTHSATLPGCLPPLKNMYLLNESKQLHQSTQLVFNDLYDRIGKTRGFKCQFLVDLPSYSLHLHPQILVERIPEHLRPKFLSSMIKEELQPTQPCVESQYCTNEEDFTSLLSSNYFGEAILRLIARRSKMAIRHELKTCLTRLKTIKIHCVHSVRVNLVKIATGEIVCSRPSPIYLEGNEQRHSLYMQHSSQEDTMKVVPLFARAVCLILKGMADSVQLDIFQLLRLKSMESINTYLDQEGCETLFEISDSPLPQLGSEIPQDKIYLLKQHPNYYFRADEYVGYRLGNDSTVFTFIYAKIIKELKIVTPACEDDSTYNMKRIYEVDIGKNEFIVVPTLDLYKIRTIVKNKFLVPYENSPSFPDRDQRSLDDILDDVTDLLEKIWFDTSLTEDERRKAIKRLYLEWHPDKNPGNEELTAEVFKHIKNELDRLEQGRPRKKKANESAGTEGSSRTSSSFRARYQGQGYSSFYDRWDHEARMHREYRNDNTAESTYYDHYGQGYPSFYERWDSKGWMHREYRSESTAECSYYDPNSSKFTRRLDFAEGERWFRQARADLSAARKDLADTDGKSFEWVSFKCQQAVEKALKGGLYATLGYLPDPRSHSNIILASSLSYHASDVDVVADSVALMNMKCDNIHPRYPDVHARPQIPNDVYTRQNAEKALEHTTNILRSVATILSEQLG
ncbi:sacsin-like [Ptychodera flava]|uniref:sacsin-like n=1 Tax=Ptychodera flava TaxID=63121 RepID=UPI003969E2FC